MGSSGKKKTTMAKLTRESRLRERRVEKQARKVARKQAAANGVQPGDELTGDGFPGDEMRVDETPGDEPTGDVADASAPGAGHTAL